MSSLNNFWVSRDSRGLFDSLFSPLCARSALDFEYYLTEYVDLQQPSSHHHENGAKFLAQPENPQVQLENSGFACPSVNVNNFIYSIYKLASLLTILNLIVSYFISPNDEELNIRSANSDSKSEATDRETNSDDEVNDYEPVLNKEPVLNDISNHNITLSKNKYVDVVMRCPWVKTSNASYVGKSNISHYSSNHTCFIVHNAHIILVD